MTKIYRSPLLFPFAGLLSLAITVACGLDDRATAQTVVIDGVSVRTSSGFSFSYTEPQVIPGYSYGRFPVYPPGYGRRINRPVLINPTIVNPTIVTSPAYPVYPAYPAYPYYAYPPIYNSIQTINRPSPEIIVDPQYGVRFKNPPGY